MALKIGAVFSNIAEYAIKGFVSSKKEEKSEEKILPFKFKKSDENPLAIFKEIEEKGLKECLKESVVDFLNDTKDLCKSIANPVLEMIRTGVKGKDIVNALLKAGNTTENVFEFLKAFFSRTAMSSFNNSLEAENKSKINDSEISNTKEFNGLTNQDMLLLSNLAYTDFADIKNKGKSLGELVDELKAQLKETGKDGLLDENNNITEEGIDELFRSGFSTGLYDTEAYAKILNEVANCSELSSLVILDNTDQVENYITATTYGHLDKNGKLIENPTVIFKGTGNSTGWADNAASLVETDTQMQKAANEYIERQQYSLKQYKKDPEKSVMISVAGHSKGGNMAQYVTLKNDKISNCISFDGEGFNKEFIKLYADEIAKNKGKITAINSYIDPVSSLLNPIADNPFYVACEPTKSETDWKGNPELKDLGAFGDLAWDSHSSSTMYKAILEGDVWTLCDKSEFSDTVKAISEATEAVDDDEKQYLAILIADAFVKYLGKGEVRGDDAEKLSPPFEINGYDLMIVKTDKGYNLYSISADSGNTVATLTKDGSLETGILEPFSNGDNEALLAAIKKKIKEMNFLLLF